MVNKKIGIALIIILGIAFMAGAQQDSRYNAGLNLPFNEQAGDVNPQTGALSLSFQDVSLPGRAGMNFSFGRYWSLSQANAFNMYRDPVDGRNRLNSRTIERYNHLGVGWSSNLPYIFTETASGLPVMNLVFGGQVFQLDINGLDFKNPAASNILWYNLKDLRVARDRSISYADFAAEFAGVPGLSLSALRADFPVADTAAGRSAYLLTLKDGSRNYFREDGQLLRQQNPSGINRIWYFYNTDGCLVLVVDTLGRKIRFSYNENKILAAVEWDILTGVRAADGTAAQERMTRSIKYAYTAGREFPEINALAPTVNGYQEPAVLKGVTDPAGNYTEYAYSPGPAGFSFDSSLYHSSNLFLLLTSLKEVYSPADGQYRSARFFEYQVPADGMHTRYFYSGYMEYYKISRQYSHNRHGETQMDTGYAYLENGEGGCFNQYAAVITQGNVTTTYTYSLSQEKNRQHVLDSLLVETTDGFMQLTDFFYNTDRTKAMEEVYRKGVFVYRQKYRYDSKGNLCYYEDKEGVVLKQEYDNTYSIPVKETRQFTEAGRSAEYKTARQLDSLGRVIRETQYITGSTGQPAALITSIDYDAFGNPVCITNPAGNRVYTVYDAALHAFPVKTWQQVTIAAWNRGGSVHENNNWRSIPDTQKIIRMRSWKIFNSDGSVWIEMDNDGYGIEHYYNELGQETGTIVPDSDDFHGFAVEVDAADSQNNDFTDLSLHPQLGFFLNSRRNNPGVRQVIDYQHDLVKSYTDWDTGCVKITGVQKDGLGHTEEEIAYTGDDRFFASRKMTYDSLGRMIALTDADAGAESRPIKVHGCVVDRYDKTWIVKYDDLGRRSKVLYPDTENRISAVKQIWYNDIENLIITVDPEGKTAIEQLDWNNKREKLIYPGVNTITDYKNFSLASFSREGLVFSFTHDSLGRQTSFTDAMGIRTEYKYDERNLLIEQNHGSGSDFMVYDNLGQLIRKTDRKGQIITFTYDEAGRKTSQKHFAGQAALQAGNCEEELTITYDNRGNAVCIRGNQLTEHYLYDHSGRVVLLERRLNVPGIRTQVAAVWGGNPATQVFRFSYTYNRGGMLTTMTYPDNSVHSFEYEAGLGRLERILEGSNPQTLKSFLSSIEYTASGAVNRLQNANSITQGWVFDNRKRIGRIEITSPDAVLEDLTYAIDGSGNILRINNNAYSYDVLNRLTGASTQLPGTVDYKQLVAGHFGAFRTGSQMPDVVYNENADLDSDGRINGADYLLALRQTADDLYDAENFAYDANGNRTLLVQNGSEYSYRYGLRNRLEEISYKPQGEVLSRSLASFVYDANGNTTEKILRETSGESHYRFTYDTLNRLTSSSRQETGSNAVESAAYFYDNAGNRFIKTDSRGNLTLYLRHGRIAVAMDIEVKGAGTQPESPPVKGVINRYVLSGDLLAGRITTTVNADDTRQTERFWYHLDHLNSTKCITREDGSIEVSYTYRAFGGQLRRLDNAGSTTRDSGKYSYGGKELDSDTNLYYFNARYYDAVTGRFINVDPVQDGTNWYVYCGNNPLNAVDPSGLSDVFMRFDKSDKKMNMVYVPKNEYGSIDYRNIVVKMDGNGYDANSTVKNFENPEPLTTPVSESGKHYYPIPHPNGTFTVSKSVVSNTDAYGPLYMETSARPKVDVYIKNESGQYIPDPESPQTDAGYRIHGGGLTGNPQGENNYLDNTRGCIRMPNDQLVDLAGYCR